MENNTDPCLGMIEGAHFGGKVKCKRSKMAVYKYNAKNAVLTQLHLDVNSNIDPNYTLTLTNLMRV